MSNTLKFGLFDIINIINIIRVLICKRGNYKMQLIPVSCHVILFCLDGQVKVVIWKGVTDLRWVTTAHTTEWRL